MLNLGLVLQRPYESPYNAYRRILVANGKLSLHNIREEIIATYADSIGNPHRYNTLQLSQLLTLHPSLRPLQTGTTEQLDSTSGYDNIKNCPECARSCYHSDLYQLPWLTQCPIHNNPLSTVCPTCKNPWPSIAQLPRIKCKTCGSKLSWKDLSKAAAFKIEGSSKTKLSALSQCLKEYRDLEKGAIIKPNVNDRVLHCHKTISIQHDLFPSMMAVRTPELSTALDDLRVKKYQVNKFTYRIRKRLCNTHRYHDLKLDSKLAKDIRKEVLQDVRQAIKDRFGIEDLNLPGACFFKESLCLQNTPYLITTAFYIWDEFINGEGISFSNFFEDNVLYLPCLMDTLVFYKSELTSLSLMLEEFEEYSIPQTMQAMIYKIDLWQTFYCILRYLDAFKYAVDNGLNWQDFHELVPKSVYLLREYGQKFAIIRVTKYKIMLILSKECTNITLMDFNPISETTYQLELFVG